MHFLPPGASGIWKFLLSYSAILKKVITKEGSGRGRVTCVMTGNFAGFQPAKFPVSSRLTFLSPEESEKV
jgi:hypothetical protein